MALSVDATKAFFVSIPKSVTMPNGDVIPIRVYSQLTFEAGTQDTWYPFISYSDGSDTPSEDNGLTKRLGRNLDTVTNVSEPFTYSASTQSYQLTEKDAVPDSVTITGTSGGTPTTFTPNTDYAILDTDGNDGYETINWLGATTPDDSTTFTVTYDHHTPGDRFGEKQDNIIPVHVHCKSLRVGDHGGAVTADIHREDLTKHILNRLAPWFWGELPEALAGLAVVQDRSTTGDYSYLEGRGVTRKGFDITLQQTVFDEIPRKAIRTITGTTQVNTGPEETFSTP